MVTHIEITDTAGHGDMDTLMVDGEATEEDTDITTDGKTLDRG